MSKYFAPQLWMLYKFRAAWMSQGDSAAAGSFMITSRQWHNRITSRESNKWKEKLQRKFPPERGHSCPQKPKILFSCALSAESPTAGSLQEEVIQIDVVHAVAIFGDNGQVLEDSLAGARFK